MVNLHQIMIKIIKINYFCQRMFLIFKFEPHNLD